MEQAQPLEPSVVGRPRFWVGPLVAGCCCAMGFGITDRVVSLQNAKQAAPTQRCDPNTVPGESMQTWR